MAQNILLDEISIWYAGYLTLSNGDKEFHPTAFLELSNLIELICLNDEIYYAGFSNFIVPDGCSQLLEYLTNQNVIKQWPKQQPTNDYFSFDLNDGAMRFGIPEGLEKTDLILYHDRHKDQINELKELNNYIQEAKSPTEKRWIDDLFTLQAYLDCCLVESTGKIAYHPSFLANEWYLDLFSIEECEKHDALIYLFYSELKNQESNLTAVINSFIKHQTITIPPLTAIVLERAKNYKDIWPITLELREELQPLRHRLNELTDRLKNPDIQMSKKRKELRKIRKTLTELSKKYSDFDFTDSRVLHTGLDPHKILKIDQVNSALTAETDYNAIRDFVFKIGVNWLRQWFNKRTLKEIFVIQKKLDKMMDHSRLIRKIWQHDINKSDMEIISSFAKEI